LFLPQSRVWVILIARPGVHVLPVPSAFTNRAASLGRLWVFRALLNTLTSRAQ
jgi:hypothetical protein